MSVQLRKKVAVLFGGRSVEHEISVITGLEILEAIDQEKYEAIPVYIDQGGRWFCGEELSSRVFYRGLPANLTRLQRVELPALPGVGGLRVVNEKQDIRSRFLGARDAEIIAVDVFFPAFHGRYGEDGPIQGLFELADVVYTGCAVLSSALAMDKYRCKLFLESHGVSVLPACLASKSEAQRDISALRERILQNAGTSDFPLFIKPLHLGSSVGIGKADDGAQLDAALANVFRYDSHALIEPCIQDLLEINVSVIEGLSEPDVSVVEVPVASSQVLTFEDKYLRGSKSKKSGKASASRIDGMAGLSRVIDPEDLDIELKAEVRSLAKAAFIALGCSGLVRFDFIYDTVSEQLYFNELNPLPGSMAHYLWAKSKPKLLYPEIIARLVEGALIRKEQSAGLQTDIGFRAIFQ